MNKRGRPPGTPTLDLRLAAAFGRGMREIRLRNQLSLRRLAIVSDVSLSHLVQIERGAQMPNLMLVFRLSQGLGVHPATLIDCFEKYADFIANETAPCGVIEDPEFNETDAG